MSDLVQRLREKVGPAGMMWVDPLKAEAADRIEALEAEILKWLDLGKRSADRIEALEAALRIIAGYDPPIDKMMGDIELSRRALKGKS